MRIAQVTGLLGAGSVAEIHSMPSVEALEEFLALRGVEARALQAPDWVQVGTTYNGHAFAQPAPPPVPEPAPEWLTLDSLSWWVDGQYQGLLAEFPEGEKTSWDTQLREASALLEDPQAPTPFIDAQAAVTGETRAALGQKILQKAGELSAFSGLLTGIRRQAISRIQDGEQLLTADLEAILATALGGQ
jgi:hypothetical protein